jgi:hypothetical protein
MTDDANDRAARRALRTGKALARAAFVNGRMGLFDRSALDAALAALIGAAATSAFPTSDVLRWVPVGPSVTIDREVGMYSRSSGRVRDIAVSDDGKRAYVATGKGGVWYTDDGGSSWAPVGGWANRIRATGGLSNAQACGCLLVAFGAGVADDFVMVGTGELAGWGRPNRPALGGLGVLAAKGPAVNAGIGGDPWEAEAGQARLEGLGVFRMARAPLAVPGSPASPPDTVLAATNAGLFVGTRRTAASGPGNEFGWIELPALGTFFGPAKPIVTDVLWLPLGADSMGSPRPDGRIVVTVAKDLETPDVAASVGSGAAYSDDIGQTWHWITGLDPSASGSFIAGRMSLARAGTSDRVYVLGDVRTGLPKDSLATVWQIQAMASATPSATKIANPPKPLWTWIDRSQRDYDQCIVVNVLPGPPDIDRVYLGGSFVIAGNMKASVWCLDVGPGPGFIAAPGISRHGTPVQPPGSGGDGAVTDGLIGDNIHPDVHIIRVAPTTPPQVWVGTDGGVYVSAAEGQVNTFASRGIGFASLEVNFIATHPTSNHFLAIGTQDNGRQLRLGDVVWQDTVGGDGGGVAIHPGRGDIVVSQFTASGWIAQPDASFINPLTRGNAAAPQEEGDKFTAFYSGIGAVGSGGTGARVTLGSNRVWLTDNLPRASGSISWLALPFGASPGPAQDARPGGTDPAAKRTFGVPAGGGLPAVVGRKGPLGTVITMKWWSASDLLVMFENGVVHWTQDPAAGTWSTRVLVAPVGATLTPAVTGAPDPATTTLTDIAPVPGGADFYLVTTGDTMTPPGDTCFFFDSASNTFLATTLRTQLNPSPGVPGPLDPVLAVTVDPTTPTEVYVGTVTGVWKGVRTTGVAAHTWTVMVNGLPPAAVQDLGIWVGPAGGPKLLRAAMQARGVWEVDLAAASERQTTYARVHAHDDRRVLPTPLANPQPGPTTPHSVFASPDIMVRPRTGPASAPAWQFGTGVMNAFALPPYQLWTFQTAFRWIFPSVEADGIWHPSLDALVLRQRLALGMSVTSDVDKALWDAVVGGTHLDATGTVTAATSDPLAVFRAPWQSRMALTVPGNEADLLQRVLYPKVIADVASVFREPNTVDVLIHHRDTRPIDPTKSFAVLLFRSSRSKGSLLTEDLSAFPAYVRSVLTADLASSATPAAPTGWTLATAGGLAVNRLSVRLDARMPRSVSFDVDLSASGINAGDFVLFLAFVGSTADSFAATPVALPASPTVADLVTRWTPAAARLVQVMTRP